MNWKKFLATMIAILIVISSLSIVPALALAPELPLGNMDLYNSNASFLNSNVAGGTNPVGFSHSSGVLSSNNATAENSCALFTGITGLTQMINPSDNSKINIDTLTFVTKTKLTISSGADASWKGGAVVLRYDSNTKYRLTLRYSPAYNATQGVLRIVGYSPTASYPATQAVNTKASVIDLTIVQTKTTIVVYLNDSSVLTYTLPTGSPYLTTPYSFGHTSVNSISNLSQTSLYFAERVNSPAAPPMAEGNATLYNAYAGFKNANVYENGVGYTHTAGTLASNGKTAENSCVLNTSITGLTQVVNPTDNSKVNIDTLTFVTKTKLTIQDMDSSSWYGAGIIIRYEPTTKKRMMIRYSQDGTLRITGFQGTTVEYLAAVSITPANTMYLTVAQTNNTIYASLNGVVVLTYSLPTDSIYLGTPYAFGLYSVYSVSNLTETSLYFAERMDIISAMPQGNSNLYSLSSGFTMQDFYGNGVNYTHVNGILSSTSNSGENFSAIKTAITGQTQMKSAVDDSKVNIDTLTLVTKTKLTIENVGAVSWYGAGFLLRYDSITDQRLMLRYAIDGKLRLIGVSGGVVSYLSTVDCPPNMSEMNFTVLQTKNTITAFIGDVPYISYTLAGDSAFLSLPYAFGLYTVFSISKLTNTSLYFTERVYSVQIGSGVSFKIKDDLMSGFTVKSNVSDLKAGISGADISNVDVFGADDTLAANDQLVATGMNVKITDSNNHLYQYKAVVYGDVNGDGKIALGDLLKVKRHLLNINILSGVSLVAGDLSAKGSISASDLIKVKKHILGIESINQNIDNTIKVLAIGNSFSQDAVEYLQRIATAGGVDMMVGNLYIGACSLETHWNNASTNAKNYTFFKFSEYKETQNSVSIEDALNSEDWDYVVMQQVSQDSGKASTFEPYLTNLSNYLKEHEPQATQLLHQTWAYEIDSTHAGFADYGSNQQTMFTAIKDAYNGASQRLGLRIIPSGEAMQKARANAIFDYANGGQTLCRDGYHASFIQGRYLLASVWYETLTGKNIADNSFTLTGMNSNEQSVLKQAAHDAAMEYGNIIPN